MRNTWFSSIFRSRCVWLAWHWQLGGERLKGNLLLHLAFGVVGSLLIWLVWWLHVLARRRLAPSVPSYVLAIEIVTMVVVSPASVRGSSLALLSSSRHGFTATLWRENPTG
jgi:hypothetical protein